MSKWEYGYIKFDDSRPTFGSNKRTYYWVILTTSGLQEERIGEGKSHVTDVDSFYEESLPKFIAQLGLERWEAFGNVYTPWGSGSHHVIHFKRPIEE